MNLSLRPGVRKTTLNPCSQGCGRYTRGASGICQPCQRGAPVPVPDLSKFRDDELAKFVVDAVAEIKRREARFQEVMRVASSFGGGGSNA